MLEQVGEGLYICERVKRFNVEPTELEFTPYVLPHLGRGEYEDLGARILEASQEQGRWVGMSDRTLMVQLIKEAREWAEYDQAREAQKGGPKNILEFIGQLFAGQTAEEEPAQDLPDFKAPISPLLFKVYTGGIVGLQNVRAELMQMAKEGFIDMYQHGNDIVYFPTEKMIKTAYEFQSARRGSA